MPVFWHAHAARRACASLGLLAIIALTIAGCATVSGAPARSTPVTFTPAVTPPATPLPSLTWRALALPSAAQSQPGGYGVSLADGRHVWLCAITNGQIVVWSTNDSGQTWTQRSSVSAPPTSTNSPTCSITPGQNDPTLVGLSWHSGYSGTGHAAVPTFDAKSWRSTDDGASWSLQSSTHALIALAADGPRLWALLSGQATPASPSGTTVQISDNYGAAWQNDSPPADANGGGAITFWLDSTHHEITLSTTGGHLWRSGATSVWAWSQLSVPSGQVTVGAYLSISGSLALCATPTPDTNQSQTISCSRDGGQTWTAVPLIPGPTDPGASGCPQVVMTSDGAALAVCAAAQPQAGQIFTLWRLASFSAASWQNLGPISSSFFSVSGHTLWLTLPATPNSTASWLATATLPA